MKPTKLKVLIALLLVFALGTIGVVSYFSWKTYSFLSSTREFKRIPAEFAEPRIVKSADFLAKEVFFSRDEGGIGSGILKSASAPDEKSQARVRHAEVAKSIYGFNDIQSFDGRMVAVGEFGGYVFGADGKLEREILFEPFERKVSVFGYEKVDYDVSADNIRLVKLDRDRFGFAAYDITAGFSVYDDKGDLVWRFGAVEHNLGDLFKSDEEQQKKFEAEVDVEMATVGDIDGDGVSEYFVGRQNDGIRAFRQDGTELWHSPDDRPNRRLVVTDYDDDGRAELIQLGTSAKIRDAQGRVTKTLNIGSSDTGQYLRHDKRVYNCDFYEGKLKCIDQESKEILKYDAPLSEADGPEPDAGPSPRFTPVDLGNGVRAEPGPASQSPRRLSAYGPHIAFVNLKKDQPAYFAALGRYLFDRAVLFIYDSKGALVHHEILGEEAETIAVRPASNGTEELLVGGKQTIWRFFGK